MHQIKQETLKVIGLGTAEREPLEALVTVGTLGQPRFTLATLRLNETDQLGTGYLIHGTAFRRNGFTVGREACGDAAG